MEQKPKVGLSNCVVRCRSVEFEGNVIDEERDRERE